MPSLNNRLINTFAILMDGHMLRGAVAGLKDGAVSMMEPMPVGDGDDRSELASSIISYMGHNNIGSIDTYVAIPPGIMDEQGMRSLSRMIRMRCSTVQVVPLQEILAYGCWNRVGHDMEDRGEKAVGRTWASVSRLVMVLLYDRHAAVAMVDSGRVISRLSFPKGLYSPLGHDADMPAKAIHGAMLDNIHSWVCEVFSPDRTIYYMTKDAPVMPFFEERHETFRIDDPMEDLVGSVRVFDLSRSGTPEYISSSRKDFNDLVIKMYDDDGKEHEYPIFQH